MEGDATNLTHSNGHTRRPTNGLGRRDFLRVTGIAGLGLGCNLLRCLAAPTPGFAGTKAKAATVPSGVIIVGLEIGTSKVCVAVAERWPDGIIKLLGIADVPSRGVDRYGICNFEAASTCVRAALLDAAGKSDVLIRSVVLAVAGMTIDPYGSEPAGERIFEWDEISYADQGDGVLRRINRADCKGARDCQVVAGANPRIEKSIRCVIDRNIEIERIVSAPVASAEAVLSANQKKLGALVIDMGAGTTDYAVYSGGALVQSDSLPIGGRHIANDLSMGLRIPMARAEKLAIEEGSVRVSTSLPGEHNRIVLGAESGFTNREIERELLNTIVHHRVRETFELVKCRLVTSGVQLDSIGEGVHLAGGCSMLPGIRELAEDVFGIPARRSCLNLKGTSGVPDGPAAQRFACALGLVKLG